MLETLDIYDLKKFRQEQLQMTIEEIANDLDYLPQEIEMMESSGKYPIDYIDEFCDYYGVSHEQLRKPREKKKKINFTIEVNGWEEIDAFKNDLLDQLRLFKKSTTKKRNDSDSEYLKEQYTETLKSLILVEEAVHSTLRKPTIAVVGMSDAGKSTIINQLIQAPKMPVSWTPTTSISVHIKHLSDRPDFLTDELVILGGQKQLLNIAKISNETYVKKYILAEGDSNLLHQYGTRQGEKMDEATHAVLYLESELLKVCDLVDLPGFGTGDRSQDDKLAEQSYRFADIIIYLSVANAFLRGTDIEFIKAALAPLKPLESKKNGLPSLSNFFMVASQAHTVNNGSRQELQQILTTNATRLYKEIPQEVWKMREKQSDIPITVQDLANRFFTYTTNTGHLRKDFENDLKELLKKIPLIVHEQSKQVINQIVFNERENLVKQLEMIHQTMTNYEEMVGKFNDYQQKEGERVQQVKNHKAALLRDLKDFEEQSITAFKAEYNFVMSEKNIIEVIEKNNYKKKKEHLERLSSFLITQLQSRLQNVLSNYAQKFHTSVDRFLEEYDRTINTDPSITVGAVKVPFNTKAAFAGSIAGLGTFGALSIWAASMGNLGAYILVVKGVSLLSAVGISVGGTAAATAGVAAIGGPIVLGIAIAGIASIAIWKAFSGSWKKDIVKSLNKQYSKTDIEQKLIKEIKSFWLNSENEVNEAITGVENSFIKHLNTLKADLDQVQSNQLPIKIQIVQEQMAVYDELIEYL